MVGTAAFTGKYYYSVDPKGRVMVPSAFRDLLAASYGPTLYVTVSPDSKCLQMFPLKEWAELLGKVRAWPKADPNVKKFMREVVGSAIETSIDGHGRILLPASLRQDLGLDGEVVIVGQIERIDIWSKSGWDKVNMDTDVDVASYEKALSDLGY